jgi:hypothetical protein
MFNHISPVSLLFFLNELISLLSSFKLSYSNLYDLYGQTHPSNSQNQLIKQSLNRFIQIRTQTRMRSGSLYR